MHTHPYDNNLLASQSITDGGLYHEDDLRKEVEWGEAKTGKIHIIEGRID